MEATVELQVGEKVIRIELTKEQVTGLLGDLAYDCASQQFGRDFPHELVGRDRFRRMSSSTWEVEMEAARCVARYHVCLLENGQFRVVRLAPRPRWEGTDETR